MKRVHIPCRYGAGELIRVSSLIEPGAAAQLTLVIEPDTQSLIYDDLPLSLHARRVIEVGANAQVDYFFLLSSWEADRAYTKNIELRLLAPGAFARVRGAYMASGTQSIVINVLQQHEAAYTVSDLLIKGIVADRAMVHYNGCVTINSDAVGSDAKQYNKNLLLHNGAAVRSVPSIKVHTNNVKCSHGSAVGSFDPMQRFYAACRGLDKAIIDYVLMHAFLKEVAEIPDIQKKIEQSVSMFRSG